MKQFELIEIISTKRKDTAGRVLLLGIHDRLLLRAIDDDIALKKRFGTLGLTRNDNPKSFGIPIFSQGELAYYLIATYLKAQRAVPFHGCLINAQQLNQSGNDVLGFLNAWEKFLQNSPAKNLETYKPGKITLELDEPPVYKADGKVKEMETLVNALQEGKIVRFLSQDKAFAFIRFVLSLEEKKYKYTWTLAPFDFPCEPDGALMHIAVIPDKKKYINKQEGMTVLKNEAVIRSPGRGEIISPIKLQPVASPGKISRASPFKIFLKKLRFLPFLFIILLVVFLIISFLSNVNSVGCKGEKWLRTNLGEISFKRPLPEQIDAFDYAKEVLKNSRCSTHSIKTCKRLLGAKISKMQDMFLEEIRSNWRFVDHSETLVKKWLEIIHVAENLELKDKPNIEDYKQELMALAKKGMGNFIQKQTKPIGESIKNLDYVMMVAQKYPSGFNEIAREAYQFSTWIKTEIQVRERWPLRKDYNSFKYIHHLLEKSSPPEACKPTAYKLRWDNIKDWTNYQLPRTKSLYNNMIGLKQDFDWLRLSNEFKKLFELPGQGNYYSTARKIFDILKGFKRKKTLTLKAYRVRFSGYFKKKIKSFYEDQKKKNNSNKIEKPRIRLELYSQGREFESMIIKNKKDFSMPLKVSFLSRLSIHVFLDYTTVSILNFEIDLFNDWLKQEGSIEEIILKDFDHHEIIRFKYKIPSARQLELEYWQ